jgi:hypothetical protein
MIQGGIRASHVIKDKGALFQQEVADRLFKVRQGFAPEDVQSCRMSTHGEDIILSPRARAVLPITVECKAQKRHCLRHVETGTPSGKRFVSVRTA